MPNSAQIKPLPRRKLGRQGLEVGCIGLGCIATAIDGVPRNKFVIATRCGFLPTPHGVADVNCSRKHIRESCEASLKCLGIDYIDLYYIEHKDHNVPIEEIMAEVKLLVKAGKIRYVGLSEVNPEDLRRAHAVHPISACQIEWSLWTRKVEEDLIPLCRELHIGVVCYSPFGRGFLTGKIKTPEDLAEDDWHHGESHFSTTVFDKNLSLARAVEEFAEQHNCTAGQLCIAWLLAQSNDVVPVPGTRHLKYLLANLSAAYVSISREQLDKISGIVNPSQVFGDRYSEAFFKMTCNGYDAVMRMKAVELVKE